MFQDLRPIYLIQPAMPDNFGNVPAKATTARKPEKEKLTAKKAPDKFFTIFSLLRFWLLFSEYFFLYT